MNTNYCMIYSIKVALLSGNSFNWNKLKGALLKNYRYYICKFYIYKIIYFYRDSYAWNIVS